MPVVPALGRWRQRIGSSKSLSTIYWIKRQAGYMRTCFKNKQFTNVSHFRHETVYHTGSALERPPTPGSQVKWDIHSICPESEAELAGFGGRQELGGCGPLSPSLPERKRKSQSQVTYMSPRSKPSHFGAPPNLWFVTETRDNTTHISDLGSNFSQSGSPLFLSILRSSDRILPLSEMYCLCTPLPHIFWPSLHHPLCQTSVRS